MATGTFAADIRGHVAKAKGNMDEAARRVTELIARDVVMGSPVDTGLFRGNWQFTEGHPANGTLVRTDKTGAGTLAQIIARIGRTGAGGVNYLTNNLVYGPGLERGASKQAPGGVIGVAAVNFQLHAARVARELSNR